jgi:E3 ubiquitin-protein ligase MYCBP2
LGVFGAPPPLFLMDSGTEIEIATRAMDKYAYYNCFRCGNAYFGGEERCAAAASQDFNPEDLVCGACVRGPAMQECPKHGTDFLEFKW